jgi:hypothetical protein
VFFGINLLIPNINMEMLKVGFGLTAAHDELLPNPLSKLTSRWNFYKQIPNLCQQYIKLISNLIEFFPDKLNAIPAGLFNNLMTSLEYGIGHDITDVNILSFQAIAPLALWAYTQELQQGRFLGPCGSHVHSDGFCPKK